MWNQCGICLRFFSAGPRLLSSLSEMKGGTGVGMKPLLLIKERERDKSESCALPSVLQEDWGVAEITMVGFLHAWDSPCFTTSDKCPLFLGLFDIFLQ